MDKIDKYSYLFKFTIANTPFTNLDNPEIFRILNSRLCETFVVKVLVWTL